MADKRKRRTKQEMADSDVLVSIIAEFEEAVEGFAAQTLWKNSMSRPFRETLSVARGVVALGQAMVGVDGFNQADAARVLADYSLDSKPGRFQCHKEHERFVASVTARVVLALWGSVAGEEKPIEEAVTAVAELKQASGGRK